MSNANIIHGQFGGKPGSLSQRTVAHPTAAKALRLSTRLAVSLALIVFSLFPNLPRLAEQISRVLHPERLVDPNFAGSDEAFELLQSELATLPIDAPFSVRVKTVHNFVRQHITYESDWKLYQGNLHDWPTAAEVWERKSDDCDGISILTASLLNRIGFYATIEYNAFHCWTKVWPPAGRETESKLRLGGPIEGPTSSRADGSVAWLRLFQDLIKPRTWTEGLTFPKWRLLLTALAALTPWLIFRQRNHLYSIRHLIKVGNPSVENSKANCLIFVSADEFKRSYDSQQSGGHKRQLSRLNPTTPT